MQKSVCCLSVGVGFEFIYHQTDYNASVINESAKETFAGRNEEKIFFNAFNNVAFWK